MTRIQILATPQWAAAAADLVTEAVNQRPSALIGVPTGNTPLPVYAELRRRAETGEWAPGSMRMVMLDEYLDPPSEGVSSWGWLRRELFVPLGIAPERVLRMPHQSRNIADACARFEDHLRDWGGCELQLLGLGGNGHIAFNEPGASPTSRTRVVDLTTGTAAANAAYWSGRFRPTQAVTMGIGTILEARNHCLLVRGAAKATALRAALQGPVIPRVPASFLQRAAHLQVIADEDAASGLD
jgi:glucosamine-6-phosphate deaminase